MVVDVFFCFCFLGFSGSAELWCQKLCCFLRLVFIVFVQVFLSFTGFLAKVKLRLLYQEVKRPRV